MRPHDLLRLADGARLRHEGPVPAWASAALALAPWVVVRRAAPPAEGLVPVGVRGDGRAQRLAALLDAGSVAARVAPEDLALARGWRHTPRTRSIGALRVLDRVDGLLTPLGLAWGPTGGVGFELATGAAATHDASDLDLILRVPEPWPLDEARKLADEFARLPVPVDVQLDLPTGAVALAEYARGGRVMLRAPGGPRLVRDPWRETADVAGTV